ncbi:HlyC/CorC family transporter [Piscirickettsia litoralis]|uniref:Magnesium/cobalt efflux protein n=1 Tax=Piscirickettsia litoralis TaxID=1891921 RepID=A0ABX3A4S0_9GAMM|nr:HlyC/CorC family transporter [Piscirickettsia litoralis]ODN43237.1 magnesium/cobalt efflux protein [Piscirickettsia litoralis]
MNHIPLSILALILVLLILISAFFSGSETAAMSLNRFRLRHLARSGKRPAKRLQKLLSRPDRLLGVILLGNTFANILASAVATVIADRLFGDIGIAIGTILLTIAVLIFAEVTPKTFAALRAEKFSFAVSSPLTLLLKLFYPAVWLINTAASIILLPFGIREKTLKDTLSREELRSVVNEEGLRMPSRHKHMLLSVLDLEKVDVDDVMEPRNEIIGIDLDSHLDQIKQELLQSKYNHLPLYRDDIDNIIGILSVRKSLTLLAQGQFSKENLEKLVEPPYFIPEGSPLYGQLINFQRTKKHIGLVIDEYGDIIGLIALDHILDEIVGDFSKEALAKHKQVRRSKDNSYMVEGSVNIRELNKLLNIELPTDGPKTLNGLIVEYLEDIPSAQACVNIQGYILEVLSIQDNLIKTIKVHPRPQTTALDH